MRSSREYSSFQLWIVSASLPFTSMFLCTDQPRFTSGSSRSTPTAAAAFFAESVTCLEASAAADLAAATFSSPATFVAADSAAAATDSRVTPTAAAAPSAFAAAACVAGCVVWPLRVPRAPFPRAPVGLGANND